MSAQMHFSLSTLSYVACSLDHRRWYREHVPEPERKVARNLKECCVVLILSILQRDGDRWLLNMSAAARLRWRLRAAENGHTDCVCLVHTICANASTSADEHALCSEAAGHGHAHTLRYLHEAGFAWDERTTAAAARAGSMECLAYAHERGCPWDERTTAGAASAGSRECLIYAHDRGCPWDERTTAGAASAGSLECLAYAHDFLCPWDVSTCLQAARQEDETCLRYAHERGCPWDVTVTCSAAAEGRLACLRYAHVNGCPWHRWTCLASSMAGHLDYVVYMVDHGGTARDDMSNGHGDCVQYLLGQSDQDVDLPPGCWGTDMNGVIGAASARRQREEREERKRRDRPRGGG